MADSNNANYRVRQDSSVNLPEYNNFIRTFIAKYNVYIQAIRDIINEINFTVMKDKRWTDSFAQEFAKWFVDKKGEADGCDLLNRAIKEMNSLFSITCYDPIKSVVKYCGDEAKQNYPMLKKAYSSSSIFDLSGTNKYDKSKFSTKDMKTTLGELGVSQPYTDSACINLMVYNVGVYLKRVRNSATNIQDLVKEHIFINKCIMITNFKKDNLNKIIDTIEQKLSRFETKLKTETSSAIESINVTQETIQTELEGNNHLEEE